MLYKPFQELKLSALGLGCMRLPWHGETDAEIDVAQTKEMLAWAMAHGVNYYDTAWGYHYGNSETVLGELLKDYPRDSFYLATKFPGYDLSNMDKVEEIFEKQLEKLQVDYFDFYLFHNVCELNIEQYLDPKYGILDYLLKQKQNGRIRHLGFSVHGSNDTLRRFLDAYGEHMEFCQIQLNYVDWSFQAAEEKVQILRDHGIPVWVMEPLRGGKLAALPEKQTETLRALRPDETTPGWAFRFLQSIPDVTVVLSGMSDMTQLKQNIATFETDAPLNDEEKAALFAIADEMTSSKSVPCTACRYCTSHCPMELDIPSLLKLYNESNFTGGGFIAPMRLTTMPEDKRPSACIGCRSCEAVCPQQIKISEVFADFSANVKPF